MNEIELIIPSVEWKEKLLEYKKEFLNYGENMINGSASLYKIEDYAQWLEKIQKDREGDHLAEGKMPATEFLGVRKVDKHVIGMIQIRHKLNEFLFRYSGHIGYSVRPSERKKGYATQMLGLALEESRRMGIEKVLITCDVNNIASEKVIINNGGIFEKEDVYEGEKIKRYWVIVK